MSLDFALYDDGHVCVAECNITHNLARMATEAGLYEMLWRPDENGYNYAHEIVLQLKDAIVDLEANPDFYKEFNAPNGWGIYEHFLSFVKDVHNACMKYPKASISVSR